ncbi:MAG: N-acetyl-gamma-glutamyl-phosphate reductase [Oscillospiraceae bacterium]|jgi:N-acetyl-gamma-glutamyl-phosphate reductase|nr:N-acetyl-gamma-glutamyl-phosphate reductase [Oscillospiraceae bacterium]
MSAARNRRGPASVRVFIDGQAGTTGLQLKTRLRARPDVELLTLPANRRRDPDARQALQNSADIVFLCLPDDAARDAARLVTNPDTCVIDASTAHRTAPGWVYGLPELSSLHRAALGRAKRIAVPGCHATGFAAAVYPLIAGGLLPADTPLTCTSLTGYSGGGKALIARYETAARTPGDALCAPRPYALTLTHKHLPEMQSVCGLIHPPHFYPVVGDMARGMLVSVPLWGHQFTRPGGARAVWELLSGHYARSRFIRVQPQGAADALEAGFLDPTALNGTNTLELFVFGHETQALVVARLDNLGKGASGAAVQCMNIARGLPEDTALI